MFRSSKEGKVPGGVKAATPACWAVLAGKLLCPILSGMVKGCALPAIHWLSSAQTPAAVENRHGGADVESCKCCKSLCAWRGYDSGYVHARKTKTKVICPLAFFETLGLMQKRICREFLLQDLLEAGLGHGYDDFILSLRAFYWHIWIKPRCSIP